MGDTGSADQRFEVVLRKGDCELRLGSSDPEWVERKIEELGAWFSLGLARQAAAGGVGGNVEPQPSKTASLAEHIRAVGPSGGLEHVLAVGYYLEKHTRLQGGFRRRDLAEGFKTVRYQHSNPGVPIATARARGLLMDGEEHEKLMLTETAERWVEERLRSGPGG